jgi:GxxExxY protein
MNIPNSELSEKVIACAFRVHQRMGFGFVESVYERCLAIEFRKNRISALFQHPVPVYYEGEEVGHFVTDVKIGNDLIIELKSVQSLVKAHEA